MKTVPKMTTIFIRYSVSHSYFYLFYDLILDNIFKCVGKHTKMYALRI